MNPAHPLFRRFERVVEFPTDLQQEPLECEIYGDDLWLRPAGSDVRVVWAYLGRRDTGELLSDAKQRKKAVKRIGKALAAKRFWRYWPLEKYGGGLFLRRNFGLIHLPDQPMMARFDFRPAFQNADDLLNAESERIETFVARLEQQTNFQEVLAWLQNHRNDWADVFFERGSQSQLEALLRSSWALFRPQNTEFDTWCFTPRSEIGSVIVWYFPLFAALERSKKDKVQRLFAVMHEHIVVRSLPDRRYSLTGEPEYMRRPNVWAPVPSMHDRMEGLLVWQEFLRDKISSQEIETLLSA